MDDEVTWEEAALAAGGDERTRRFGTRLIVTALVVTTAAIIGVRLWDLHWRWPADHGLASLVAAVVDTTTVPDVVAEATCIIETLERRPLPGMAGGFALALSPDVERFGDYDVHSGGRDVEGLAVRDDTLFYGRGFNGGPYGAVALDCPAAETAGAAG